MEAASPAAPAPSSPAAASISACSTATACSSSLAPSVEGSFSYDFGRGTPRSTPASSPDGRRGSSTNPLLAAAEEVAGRMGLLRLFGVEPAIAPADVEASAYRSTPQDLGV